MYSEAYRDLLRKKSSRIINVNSFAFREIFYPEKLEMPKHAHDVPFISFVVQGGYREKINNKVRECRQNKLIVHTAQESHAVGFHDTLTRIFQIDIAPEWFSGSTRLKHIFDSPHESENSPLSWIATRLFQEYRLNDEFSSFSIEGLMLELLASTGRAKDAAAESNRAKPGWLTGVEEILNTKFVEKISVDEIAREANIHPVHLSREFRRRNGCTIGEFVRQKRIQAACEKLSETNMGLVDIGESVGFYDQSHFISNFKRITGFTPGQYRNVVAQS